MRDKPIHVGHGIRTIMYDRIDPLTPISDPTVVRRGLSSINPDIEAHRSVVEIAALFDRNLTFRNQREPRVRVQHSDHDSCAMLKLLVAPQQSLHELTHICSSDRSRGGEALDEAQNCVCT